MKKDSQEDWIELYEYVKKDILGYTEDMKLPKRFVLRLQGIHKGVFIGNKNIPSQAEYSYKTILLTFKIKKLDIIIGMKNNTFKDENHKINYIMSIVESAINDTVIKMKNAKKAEEAAIQVEIQDSENKATYKKKTKENKNKRLNDLW